MDEGLIKESAQIGVSSATAGATAKITGGDFWQAFTFTAALGGADLINAYARLASINSSEQDINDPTNTTGVSRNLTGSSDNFWNDEFGEYTKLGGARWDVQLNGAPDSPLGSGQGGPGKIFGIPYSSGSFADNVIEAYSGIHDFLNSFIGYNKYGNASNWGGGFGLFLRGFDNVADLFLATPFAAASLMSAYQPFLISLPAVKNQIYRYEAD